MIKKLIMLIISALILLSCAQQQNLTQEEREKFRRGRMVYEAGQRGGP